VSIPPDLRFFFIHVMKTAGSSFGWHIRKNYEPDEVYPNGRLDSDMTFGKFRIDYLTKLSKERRARIRVYDGHFPFVAAQLLGMELVILTIRRDPVERTISYLKQCKRQDEQHRSLALEEIYEDPFVFSALIHNHQTKLFAMTRLDLNPLGYFDVIEIDDRRLAMAKANLERVDVLGLQEHFPKFLDELAQRYGWRFEAVPDLNVSGASKISRPFRRRIAQDNAADVAFYDHARRLWQQR
jgi:hypothetical protein